MRAITFARSLVMFVIVAGGIPIALAAVSNWRFGGRLPVSGLPGPEQWRLDDVRSVLADPLTDRILADLVIRGTLFVAWVAVLVFVATVVAEAAHMLRHGGHHLPDV